MKSHLLDILACPECAGGLTLSAGRRVGDEVESGALACAACGRAYPIVRHVPRFVPAENYASNFGFQWNRFRQTQLDSHTGVPISRERLLFSTEWGAGEIAGKRVLDVGCGAGRFAEVTLALGAELVALDYSGAVDACWDNLAAHPRLNVVQGDIYKLPFKPGAFELALRNGRPLLPILIEGTSDALPKRGFVLRGRHPLRIRVLEPWSVERFAGLSAEQLAEAMREHLAKELGEARVEPVATGTC